MFDISVPIDNLDNLINHNKTRDESADMSDADDAIIYGIVAVPNRTNARQTQTETILLGFDNQVYQITVPLCELIVTNDSKHLTGR